VQDKDLPQTWAQCSNEQKEMVMSMCYEFSLISGLTEPSAWQTKVKMWLTPMVHVMNANTWTDEGVRRGKRVMRQVVGDYLKQRIEIKSVKSIQVRACNLVGSMPFISADFPHLSDDEFNHMQDRRLNKRPRPAPTPIDPSRLAEAKEFYDSLDGESFDEKMKSFEIMLYGEELDGD